MVSDKEKLQEVTHSILNCNDDFSQMEVVVGEMYNIFKKYTGVGAYDQTDTSITLPSGKAISPSSAAHCLLEMKRTAFFLRGIYRAIQQKLNAKKAVNILYAGCGPYATLITPLLPFLVHSDVDIDLLDINEISLLSAHNVIDGLGLGNKVRSYYLEDAAVYKLQCDYDIVISETLQSGLRNEPFVSIMKNIVSQLNTDSIFIPSRVVLSAALDYGGSWDNIDYIVKSNNVIDLGVIMDVNSQTVVENFQRQIVKQKLIDSTADKHWNLMIYTSVHVFDDIQLKTGDCSLNIPLKIDELVFDNSKIEFEFQYNDQHPVSLELRKTILYN